MKGAFALIVGLSVVPLAQAQSFTVLTSFNGVDGAFPSAGLVRDFAGNLYGTTEFANPATGTGNVFKLDPTGKETVLFSFTGGTDGGHPEGGVIRDSAGNLYRTTQDGGDLSCFFPGTSGGCGVVFKLDPSGQETVLHSFTGGTEGAKLDAALIRDSAGNLYGTTELGGDLGCASGNGQGCGTVFKLDPTGTLTVLHSFTGPDGASPTCALVRNSEGNLYGTAGAGGSFSDGTVFKPGAAGTLTVLHSFGSGKDGLFPFAGLIRDSARNLYGTTTAGGSDGLGTVFKVDSTGKESVLHSFANRQGEGRAPFGGLLRDASGNLFGTTSSGGDLNACAGEPTPGCGTVFELVTGKREVVLHIFEENADGAQPLAALIEDSSRNLYGAAANGGRTVSEWSSSSRHDVGECEFRPVSPPARVLSKVEVPANPRGWPQISPPLSPLGWGYPDTLHTLASRCTINLDFRLEGWFTASKSWTELPLLHLNPRNSQSRNR